MARHTGIVMTHLTAGKIYRIILPLGKYWPRRRANAPGPGRNLYGGPDTVSVPRSYDERPEPRAPGVNPGEALRLIAVSREVGLLRDQSARRLLQLLSRFVAYVV